ncbi:hypothetical protein [Taibaiella chishuiensis]|uniref:Uncharacterized protein n=1 Tax=Taibaiella chishuiensis TaxID=1434707 RepID=A0A2P8CV33_9BACT|nr:hypothetical protein [Taibaiella chishuiensis]PSK88799.1 hypothetical protein B0I18_11410 [Taibaiella chishuiensis]
MKKKTQIKSLKSLRFDKAYIMELSNGAGQVLGGRGSVRTIIDDTSVIDPTVTTTDMTLGITCVGCPPQRTKPPFCIF